MSLDEPMAVKVARWRQQAAEGTMTLEDYKAAVREMRGGRLTAASSTPKRATKQPVDLATLENEIDNL